jgi:transglutaminase-like putative cysteine protease
MSDVRSCSIQTTQVRFGYVWAEVYLGGVGWVRLSTSHPGVAPGGMA